MVIYDPWSWITVRLFKRRRLVKWHWMMKLHEEHGAVISWQHLDTRSSLQW